MENFNLQLAQVNANIDQILQSIPEGVAYFILKTKTREFEKKYNEQVQREYAALVQQQHQDQVEKVQGQVEET